jgi:hypothetical protein
VQVVYPEVAVMEEKEEESLHQQRQVQHLVEVVEVLMM